MAGFRTHVGVSSALGVCYAGALHTMYGVPLPTAAVAGTLCGVAGMLPDLDSDFGVPLREAMSFAAATIPVLLVNRFESLELTRDSIVLISIGLYLFVRFGVATLIRKFTVHRGMFHSIPAMLTFGGIAYLLTGGCPTNERYMMAGGVMGGFLSHLVLDEIYAVEFKSGRWRTKKSFGTALKLWGGNGKSNFVAYSKLAIVGMGVVGEPNALKNFVANRPQISEAINIVTQLGQSDPKLAGQFDQLKNILGTLNVNPGDATPPQNGGGWSNTPAPQPNSPYGYPPSPMPVSNTAPSNQYSASQQLPPQQLPNAPPINNQRADWQWPGASQSYNNSGQPAQFQNSFDTAQRPMGQYPQ
jgi:LexA-binding, inner membrane-associated putative hydrolase